jgi:hypothetical protein
VRHAVERAYLEGMMRERGRGGQNQPPSRPHP